MFIRVVRVLIILGFVIKTTTLIEHIGPRPEVPNTWENNVFFAATTYLQDGVASNSGLPVYPMDHETPISKLQQTRVYTHFFPGDSYLLWMFGKITGNHPKTFQYARFFPVLVTLLALLWFAKSMQARNFQNWPAAQNWIIGLCAVMPVFYQWSISLTGIGYSSASVLIGMTMGLRSTDAHTGSQQTRVQSFAVCFCLGFVAIYLLMTHVFVVCLAPIVGQLLAARKGEFREALYLSISVGLGILTGYLLHFWQIASFLDSWSLAWQDQFNTFFARGDYRSGISRIMLIGQYSDHARPFVRINSLHLFFSGLFGSWLLTGSASRRSRLAIALIVSLVASYAFIILMRQSAVVHWHIYPHIFVLLYITCLIIMLSLACERAVSKT